jgi:hypothetical protein
LRGEVHFEAAGGAFGAEELTRALAVFHGAGQLRYTNNLTGAKHRAG